MEAKRHTPYAKIGANAIKSLATLLLTQDLGCIGIIGYPSHVAFSKSARFSLGAVKILLNHSVDRGRNGVVPFTVELVT
jgi:hypothetical protein